MINGLTKPGLTNNYLVLLISSISKRIKSNAKFYIEINQNEIRIYPYYIFISLHIIVSFVFSIHYSIFFTLKFKYLHWVENG